MPAKRILLVDDQRDVTRFLRAALETLGRDDTIVEVRSGEEAFLEIGRGGADLLVVDVKLPGMSGIEVVRRLRRVNSKAAVILISGAMDARMESEAANLGVLAFMRKPLNASVDKFLQLAQQALSNGGAETELYHDDEPVISDRLSTLRRDLGANAVFLVDMQGRITVRAGDITSLDVDELMGDVIAAMSASLKVSRTVGGLIPSNVLFFDGDEYDVYAANVGQFYAIVVVFDGERGAGQMGPVMRYGRQCADDLLNSLVMLGVKVDSSALFAGRSTEASAPVVVAAAKAAPVSKAQATPAVVASPVQPAPVAPPPPPVVEKPMTPEELKALEAALAGLGNQNANAFWDNLGEDDEVVAGGNALSFEEAEKQGLIKK
jgi:CheY-like chemotaxis protein